MFCKSYWFKYKNMNEPNAVFINVNLVLLKTLIVISCVSCHKLHVKTNPSLNSSPYLCMHHGLCPAWWTACHCARWENLRRCRGNVPPAVCRSQPQVPTWSLRIPQMFCAQPSPPGSPEACKWPDWSTSKCSQALASILHLYSQNLAVRKKRIHAI